MNGNNSDTSRLIFLHHRPVEKIQVLCHPSTLLKGTKRLIKVYRDSDSPNIFSDGVFKDLPKTDLNLLVAFEVGQLRPLGRILCQA